MPQVINPAVVAEAEMFSDGVIGAHVLADVAAMRGLPLYVEAPAPVPPSDHDRLSAEVANAAARVRESKRLIAGQRRAIGDANRLRTPEGRRRVRAIEFRLLNKRRAELRADLRRLAAAEAAVASLSAPLALAA